MQSFVALGPISVAVALASLLKCSRPCRLPAELSSAPASNGCWVSPGGDPDTPADGIAARQTHSIAAPPLIIAPVCRRLEEEEEEEDGEFEDMAMMRRRRFLNALDAPRI